MIACFLNLLVLGACCRCPNSCTHCVFKLSSEGITLLGFAAGLCKPFDKLVSNMSTIISLEILLSMMEDGQTYWNGQPNLIQLPINCRPCPVSQQTIEQYVWQYWNHASRLTCILHIIASIHFNDPGMIHNKWYVECCLKTMRGCTEKICMMTPIPQLLHIREYRDITWCNYGIWEFYYDCIQIPALDCG